jgi:hypothetical protein
VTLLQPGLSDNCELRRQKGYATLSEVARILQVSNHKAESLHGLGVLPGPSALSKGGVYRLWDLATIEEFARGFDKHQYDRRDKMVETPAIPPKVKAYLKLAKKFYRILDRLADG